MSDANKTLLAEAIRDLREDLLAPGGPQISTMGTYRFAILVYDPRLEYPLRGHVHELAKELGRGGWNVHPISLHKLFFDRLRQEFGEDLLRRWIATERRLHGRSSDRGLEYLKDKIGQVVEGPDGIARDVAAWIDDYVEQHPGIDKRKTVIFLHRAGALYPFFRSSAMLKHLDGRTRGLPVVLFYPGKRLDLTRLSFMGELPADGDYRPRIYGDEIFSGQI